MRPYKPVDEVYAISPDTWVEFLEFLNWKEKEAKANHADSGEYYWRGYEAAINDVKERLSTTVVTLAD